MSAFGWCMDGKHEECIRTHQRFYIGPKKVGRKTVEGIIYLEEWQTCACSKRGCPCYSGNQKTKRKRKK